MRRAWLLAALALAGACSAAPPPRRASAPRGSPPAPPILHLIECRAEGRFPLPRSWSVLTSADLAAIVTGSPRARADAMRTVREWVDETHPLLTVRADDAVLWAVAPELATSVLALDSETLAALDQADKVPADDGEAPDDADRLGETIRRHPFSPEMARFLRSRADLLLEQGDLGAAVVAFEDALAQAKRQGVDQDGGAACLALARELWDRQAGELAGRWSRAEGGILDEEARGLDRSTPAGVDSCGTSDASEHGIVLFRPKTKERGQGVKCGPLATSWLELPEGRTLARRAWAVVKRRGRVFVADGDYALALDERTDRLLWFRVHGIAQHVGALADFPVSVVELGFKRSWHRHHERLFLTAGPDFLEVAYGRRVERLDARTGALVSDNAPPLEAIEPR